MIMFIGSGVITLRANLYIQDLRAGLIRWKRVADLDVKVFLGRRLAPPLMCVQFTKMYFEYFTDFAIYVFIYVE